MIPSGSPLRKRTFWRRRSSRSPDCWRVAPATSPARRNSFRSRSRILSAAERKRPSGPLANSQRKGEDAMTFPADYRDSRYRYQDVPYLRMYEREPENPPLLVADEAPFPIWIVPPGWRMARLSDIAQALNKKADPEQAASLLKEAGVPFAESIDIMAFFGWKTD